MQVPEEGRVLVENEDKTSTQLLLSGQLSDCAPVYMGHVSLLQDKLCLLLQSHASWE